MMANMSSCEAVRQTEVVAGLDLSVADADDVVEMFGHIRHVEGWLAARRSAGMRRLEELRQAGAAGRVEVAVGQLWGAAEARKIARRGEILQAAPAIETVLADGQITAAHVDAVAAAVKQTPAVLDHQDELAASATRMGPDEFADVCKRMAYLLADDGGVATLDKQRRDSTLKRWVDRFSGMYHVKAELDPERGAQLWAALDAEVERHFHSGADPELSNDQRAAAALHAACTRSGDRHGRPAATVHVHIDLDTLRDGLRPGSTVAVTGGGSLPVETIRRMACDAEIIPYVLNGDGVVLDVGRSKRLATRQQRHALRAMYDTCGIGDCTVPFDHTRIHHITPFQAGGTTDLAKLLPVCDPHHHDIHEGGRHLHLDPATRTLTITRPDGTITHTTLRPRRRDAA